MLIFGDVMFVISEPFGFKRSSYLVDYSWSNNFTLQVCDLRAEMADADGVQDAASALENATHV